MFGDPVSNPKGWEVILLKDCCIDEPNNGFFAKNEDYNNNGVPIIWISDFMNQFYVNTLSLKSVRVKSNDLKKYSVTYGDVLFCRSSLTFKGIAKASIIPKDMINPTIFECHIIRCKLNLNLLLPEFFRILSDTSFFRMQVEKNSKTSTMTTISQDGIINTK